MIIFNKNTSSISNKLQYQPQQRWFIMLSKSINKDQKGEKEKGIIRKQIVHIEKNKIIVTKQTIINRLKIQIPNFFFELDCQHCCKTQKLLSCFTNFHL